MEWWRDDGQLWRFKRDTVWSMLVNNVIIAIKCHQMALMSQFYSNQCRGARPSGLAAPCALLQNEATKLKKVWRLKTARGTRLLTHLTAVSRVSHTGTWTLGIIQSSVGSSRPCGLLILTMQHSNTNVSFHLSSWKQWSFHPKTQIRIDISGHCIPRVCVKVRPPRPVSRLSLRQSSICPRLSSPGPEVAAAGGSAAAGPITARQPSSRPIGGSLAAAGRVIVSCERLSCRWQDFISKINTRTGGTTTGPSPAQWCQAAKTSTQFRFEDQK